MTSGVHRTIAAALRHEGQKIKGSRFIVTAVPIGDESEVPPVLSRLREEFPEANHHCYAYRLGTGKDRFRYSDDGEPSGTAGRPILQRIDGHELTDVLVVVSRIFGGTKLGAGGLIRAYGGAAGEALDRAEVREVVRVRRAVLSFAYELSGAVRRVLVAAGVELLDPAYGETVVVRLEIPEDQADAVLSELRESTSGGVVIDQDG